MQGIAGARRARLGAAAAALAAAVVALGAGQGHADVPAGAAIVLVVAAPEDAALARRLAAELAGLRFRAVEVVAPPGAAARRPLEELARSRGAIAAIRVVPLDGAVEVWIADRVTGKTVLREVLASGGADERDMLVSLRAVELLRASLLELGAPHAPPGEVSADALPPEMRPLPGPAAEARAAGPAPAPAPAAPAPGPAVASSGPAPAVGPSPTATTGPVAPTLEAGAHVHRPAPARLRSPLLQAGIGMLLNVGTEGRLNFTPAPEVVLGARWRLGRLTGVTTILQLPTYPGVDQGWPGAVLAWSTLLGAALRVGSWDGPVLPAVEMGLFGAWVFATARVPPPFESHPASVFAAVAFARLSLSVRLWRSVRLLTAAWGGISAPWIQLGDTVDWGLPLLWSATVGLEVGLP
jgi:hypothetical protein